MDSRTLNSVCDFISGKYLNMGEEDQLSTDYVWAKKPARLIQCFTAFAATMGPMSFGASYGYSSPAGLALNATLSSDEMMWFTSSINLGAMAGGPIGGVLINMVGRKGTMLGSVLLSLTAWSLIAFDQSVAALVSGRIIGGLFMGMSSLVVPTYIGEIASVDIRGALGSGFQLMATTGILYVYVFGAVIEDYQVLAGICAIPTVIYAVLVFFVNESPTYLIAKGKENQAWQALQRLRGKDYNIDPEFKRLRETQEILDRNRMTWKDLLQPHIFKPTVICIVVMFFQQSSGIPAVFFNLGRIFKESGSDNDENTSAIYVALVLVVSTAVALPLVDRCGRKILLVTSFAVMAVSLISMGIFFYEKERGNSITWLPLTSLIVFIVSFSFGTGSIPWVLMGEMFSLEVRAVASSLATLVSWSSCFLNTFTYDPMKNALGDYGAFWCFSGICIAASIFCLVFVPETKGKTVQEIAELFGGPVVSEEFSTNQEQTSDKSL